ncbi:hypothetical protein E4U27_002948 [Claviceps purpurea]|nr:hypothetical protein E4U27_002948 [Claviceps purpurea]
MPEQMTRLPQPEMNIEPVQAEANRQRSLSTAPDFAVDHPRSHKETTQTMASVHEKCSSRLRPSLQNLPLELLERIFLYSTNFALPQITGPWDEEKKRRLFWLVRAGASVTGGFRKLGWKVRLACLDTTLIYAKEPDPLIINCLIGPWIFRGGFPEDVGHKRLVDVCSRLDRGGDTPDMREVLREAVRAMDSDGQFSEHHFPDAEYRSKERIFGWQSVEE